MRIPRSLVKFFFPLMMAACATGKLPIAESGDADDTDVAAGDTDVGDTDIAQNDTDVIDTGAAGADTATVDTDMPDPHAITAFLDGGMTSSNTVTVNPGQRVLVWKGQAEVTNLDGQDHVATVDIRQFAFGVNADGDDAFGTSADQALGLEAADIFGNCTVSSQDAELYFSGAPVHNHLDVVANVAHVPRVVGTVVTKTVTIELYCIPRPDVTKSVAVAAYVNNIVIDGVGVLDKTTLYKDNRGPYPDYRVEVEPVVNPLCNFSIVGDDGVAVDSATMPVVTFPPHDDFLPQTGGQKLSVDVSSLSGCGDLTGADLILTFTEVGTMDGLSWIDAVSSFGDHLPVSGALTMTAGNPEVLYAPLANDLYQSGLAYEFKAPFSVAAGGVSHLDFTMAFGSRVPSDDVRVMFVTARLGWTDPTSGETFLDSAVSASTMISFVPPSPQ